MKWFGDNSEHRTMLYHSDINYKSSGDRVEVKSKVSIKIDKTELLKRNRMGKDISPILQSNRHSVGIQGYSQII